MHNERLKQDFKRTEFACHGKNCCGGSAPVDMRLVYALQHLRTMLKTKVNVKSGFRCIVHNKEEGGADESTHIDSQGSDVTADGKTPDEIAVAAESISDFKEGGIGIYPWGVHLDVRLDGPARWDKR